MPPPPPPTQIQHYFFTTPSPMLLILYSKITKSMPRNQTPHQMANIIIPRSPPPQKNYGSAQAIEKNKFSKVCLLPQMSFYTAKTIF